jgi:hypothetical protein
MPTLPTNQAQRQDSLRAKAKTAMERLDSIENQVKDVQQSLPRVLVAVNNALAQLGQQLAEMREYVDGIIGVVGAAEVSQVIAENRATRMKEQAEQTKLDITKALEEKRLVAADKVSENSLVVGSEVDKAGLEIPPGYAAVRFATLSEQDYKDKLLNQPVGTVLETKQGGKFTVNAIYDFVPQEAPAALAPGPTPVADVAPTEQATAPAAEPVATTEAPVASPAADVAAPTPTPGQ